MTTTEANYQTFAVVPPYAAPQYVDQPYGAMPRQPDRDGPLLWSGKVAPPAIGSKVYVAMNRLGEGTVVGYFAEYGWLGLLVKLHNAPAWHRKQRNNDPMAHVFGIEWEDAASRSARLRVESRQKARLRRAEELAGQK